MSVEGKTVLITGASRGIGEATARLFAGAGANVALVARGASAIAEIAETIGPAAHAIPADVGDWPDVARAVDRTCEHFGALDVLIGNAGVIEPIARLDASDPDEWSRVIDVNLKGVYYGMRAAIPHMVKAGGGTVITLSSGAAHHPLEGWSHYCASKAGAAMLTRCAHTEYRSAGVRAMGLAPGTVATRMQREIKASGVNPISELEWEAHVPPEWPARALLWLCSSDADEFIGQEVSLRDECIRRRVGLIH